MLTSFFFLFQHPKPTTPRVPIVRDTMTPQSDCSFDQANTTPGGAAIHHPTNKRRSPPLSHGPHRSAAVSVQGSANRSRARSLTPRHDRGHALEEGSSSVRKEVVSHYVCSASQSRGTDARLEYYSAESRVPVTKRAPPDLSPQSSPVAQKRRLMGVKMKEPMGRVDSTARITGPCFGTLWR